MESARNVEKKDDFLTESANRTGRDGRDEWNS